MFYKFKNEVKMPGARHISSLDCQQELLLMEGQHPLDVWGIFMMIMTMMMIMIYMMKNVIWLPLPSQAHLPLVGHPSDDDDDDAS